MIAKSYFKIYKNKILVDLAYIIENFNNDSQTHYLISPLRLFAYSPISHV